MKEVIHQWEQAAERFAEDQERSEYARVNREVVRQRFQGFRGESVLDLGCGYGYYTDYFREVGAQAIGMDGAGQMIDLAKERYPDSCFLVADLTDPFPFGDGTFDLVFCNQVLMDVEPLEGVFRECHRVLKEHGILYYSIVHPAFYDGSWLVDDRGYKYAKTISRYRSAYASQNRFWGETAHFHRPLSTYLNAAADAGFALLRTDEPQSYDGLRKTAELPLFFFAEYGKR